MTYVVSGTPITLLRYLIYTASGSSCLVEWRMLIPEKLLSIIIFVIFPKYTYVYCLTT